MKYFNDFYSKEALPSRTVSAVASFHTFSTEKIDAIRALLKERLKSIKFDYGYCVVAVGSYGRYEASKESDLDVYIIYSKEMPEDTKEEIDKIVRKAAMQADIVCSIGFESISLDIMHKNIGGKADTNASITNRILFLLESECLYNDSFFFKSYEKILRKYLKGTIDSENKPPRFLLSDIIRYYRTMCVDYEFKTTEQNKDWAIRNIKLRFSRKGLYFGGIVILLNSLNKHREQRYDYILQKLRLPFAEKICHILIEQGKEDHFKNILILYSDFLDNINKHDTRRQLKKLKRADREDNKAFTRLTNKAQKFNDSLRYLLNEGYWGGKNYLDLLVL